MSIRETLNKQPLLSAGIAGVVVVLVIGFLFRNVIGGGDPRLGSGKAFYSTDDGLTFFSADSSNIPPFDHSGKQAVQAMVYSSDGGQTKFVGYLQRYTPVGQQKMAEKRKQITEQKGLPSLDPELLANTEIKKPGDKNWAKMSDTAQVSRITAVVDPKNPSKPADPIDP